jgi:Holliday junction resolvase RusA-like endonuclease
MIIKWAGKACGINGKLKPGKYGNLYNSQRYKKFVESLFYSMITAKSGKWGEFPYEGKIKVILLCYGNFDIDALLKGTLDSLEKSQIITNDSKIKRLYIEQEDKRTEEDELIIQVEKFETKGR